MVGAPALHPDPRKLVDWDWHKVASASGDLAYLEAYLRRAMLEVRVRARTRCWHVAPATDCALQARATSWATRTAGSTSASTMLAAARAVHRPHRQLVW